MTFLLLQTFVWMFSAFLLGCMLGCLAKRLFKRAAAEDAAVPVGTTAASRAAPAPVIEARNAPAPVTPPAPAGGIERAGTGYDYPAGSTRGTPERVQPHIQKIDLTAAEGAARTYPVTTIGIPPGHVVPNGQTYSVTTVGIPSGHVTPSTAAPAPREPSQPRPQPLRPELARPGSAAAASAAATVQPPAPAGEQVFTPAVASASAAGIAARVITTTKAPTEMPVGDDLTRIRAIDTTLQSRLRDAGVTRLAQIAKWTPGDVARISQTLGLTDRIGAENWIEQAQILASGGETEYSRRRQRGEIPTRAPAPPASSPGPASPASAEPPRPAAVSSMAERATAIAAAAAAAASAAAAATPTTPTPARLTEALRQSAGSPESAGETGRGPRPDLSGLRSVRSEALRGDVTALETARAGGPGRGIGSFDDLKRIRGIGVLIEKKLNSIGVSTYEQIANWTNADIDRVSQILDFKGRVERESWVEQARILASGGQTDFASRVDRGEV